MSDVKELSVSRYIDAPPEKVWDVDGQPPGGMGGAPSRGAP